MLYEVMTDDPGGIIRQREIDRTTGYPPNFLGANLQYLKQAMDAPIPLLIQWVVPPGNKIIFQHCLRGRWPAAPTSRAARPWAPTSYNFV